MSEPGEQETKSTETPSSGVKVESTPAIEGKGGIRTGHVTVTTEYHVTTDGTVVFGPRSKAVELNQAVSDKTTRI